MITYAKRDPLIGQGRANLPEVLKFATDASLAGADEANDLDPDQREVFEVGQAPW